jgi:hypothetical protein
MLAGSKLVQNAAHFADPVWAGNNAGAPAENGGVVDLNGWGIDLGFETGQVVDVVVERLFLC